ncbi:hypothetical protein FB446DRAFT_842792 [Lentinula raphanica]|uniref:DNA 3'-5' helicase n=1 Tax=Lentinula raphanica TaxID=153919 RepID=A0AA38PJ84_9AGAR|nr:hypothetical protein FB446DRAFT_842792 [Lentinula raphanica]KAJ3823206.1 hypothetical protein F5880DRAFT_1731624 [Lentinula raphanica]KAJ3843967.1 hypothetical protein F5878DRAFT_721029 [Lentinula raphanica]
MSNEMPSTQDANTSTISSFGSQEGRALISRIVQLYAPSRPYDYVLDGIGQLLDGVESVAVTLTSLGKTAYIAYTALVIRELTAHPERYPEVQNLAKKFPRNPLMLAICPTSYLNYQLRKRLSSIGLNALIINSKTKGHARENSLADLSKLTTDLTLSIVLLSPEQLKSEEFARTLADKTFFARLYALAVDEMPLLLTWGSTSTRKPFQQIGLVPSRLPDRDALMGLIATMRSGTALKKSLGLKTGEDHLIRRSNQRHDIQLVFQEITSSIKCFEFPELDWILQRNRKTIIFCDSIDLGNRVRQSLYYSDKALGGSPLTILNRIREYNLLSDAYNEKTCKLMQSGDCDIIIATNALAVEVDMDNIEDIVVFGNAKDADQLLQMIGCIQVGPPYRQAGEQSRYEGVIHFDSRARKPAEEALHTTFSIKAAIGSDVGMDEGSAERYISGCKIDIADNSYDDPHNDGPGRCPSSSMPPPSPPRVPCPCSGCTVKLFIPSIPSESAQDVQRVAGAPKEHRLASIPSESAQDVRCVSGAPKKHRGISSAMRSHGMRVLKQFRWEIYRVEGSKMFMLPPDLFFTDDEMKKVLNNFDSLEESSDVTNLLKGFKNKRLMPYDQQLFLRIESLRVDFQRIEADQNLEATEREQK